MSGYKNRPIDPLSQAARLSRTQPNPIQVQHHTIPVQAQQPYYPQAPQQQQYPQAPLQYQQQEPQYQQPAPQYQQPLPQQYQQPVAPHYPQAPQQQQYQHPLPYAPSVPQAPYYPAQQQTHYQQPQQYQQATPEPPRTRRLITGDSMPSPATQKIPLPTATQRVSVGPPALTGEIPVPPPTRALNVGVPQNQGQVIPAPTTTQRLDVGQARTSSGGNALVPANLNGVAGSQMANPPGPEGQPIPPPPPTRLLVGKTGDLKPAQAIVAATPATAVAAAAPVDEAALDSAVTSLGPVPYYSLSQIVENLQTLTGSHVAAESNPGERYLDEQEIGEGGTSVVYRAKDRRMRRDVALKRFKSISRTDKDRDYALEMKSASHINHPYVVSIYDADIDEKGRYIAMELIEGFNMEEAIKLRELNFDINRFINFAEQALEGLEATHKAGLLHLDLKPSNIMLCEQGGGRDIIKLIDYGRAQLIQNEAGDAPKGRGLEGTIFFCSPEQILREDLDVRTDLYALGTVFYWMLTHRRPFDGGNPISIMSAHLQHIVTDISEIIPNIPKWLGEWVMSLIALEKDDRPQSAAEALDTLLNGRDEQKVTKFRA